MTVAVTLGSVAGYGQCRPSLSATNNPTLHAMKRFTLAFLFLTIAACSNGNPSVTGVDTKQSQQLSNDVTAQRTPEGVRVTNGGGKDIRFLAKNAVWLGLLAGCHHEPNTCATLKVGQTTVVRFNDIFGFNESAAQLEVWYWVAGAGEPAGKVIQLD
jgi:hypothetical protein